MDSELKKTSRRQALLAGAGLAGLTAGSMKGRGAIPSPALGPSAPLDYGHSLPIAEINSVFGVDGTVEPGGVLHFDFSRSDVQWTVMGISVDADWGFDTEITFQPLSNGAIVKWEFCLLDKEVNPVLQAIFNANLTPRATNVNAIHNHFLEITPEAKFFHGTAIGDPVNIAKELYDALKNQSGQPFQASPPQDTGLPNEKITAIIGGSSMISGKILTVSVDRKDSFREPGVPLQPASQIETMFNFQKVGDNQAIVLTEWPLRPSELSGIGCELRSFGFNIGAVHNHELFIHPRLYYLHAVIADDPLKVAAQIRQALEHANFKLQS